MVCNARSKEFDLNKYHSHSLKGCVLETNFEYPKRLQELHSDYPIVGDKIEIKGEELSDYQLIIVDIYNISIRNVKKNECITFLTRKNIGYIPKITKIFE